MYKRLSAYVLPVVLAVAAVVLVQGAARAETASFVPCENALDGARYRHTATKILAGPQKGKVLIVGGDSESAAAPTNPSSIYSSCFLYDPALNTFTQVASLNIARTLHSAIALPDGRVLVAGGYNGTNELSSCEIYDPLTDEWTLAAYLGQARSRFTLTMLYTGYVLAVGGYANGSPLASCELYDVTSDVWQNTVPLASARYDHAAVRMLDGRVLVAGGNKSAASPNNTYQIFTPPTSTAAAAWTPPSVMPFSFDSCYQYVSGLLDNGDVVIGASNSGGRALRFNGEAWSQAGNIQSRWGGTQIRMATNNVVEIGGWGNAKVVDIYLPNANSWNTYTSIYGHTFAPAVLLDDGRILMCAGNNSGSSELLVSSTIAKPATVILGVSTPYGNPSPFGIHAYTIGTTVTCTLADNTFSYGGRTYTCTGYTGTGSAPSGNTFEFSFTIDKDSRVSWNWTVAGGTYKLTVVSAHGSPVPAVGVNNLPSGTTINARVDAMVDTGEGVRYICKGWTGTGSVPREGTTNEVSFDLNMNSTLTWLWRTEYRLVVENPTGLGNPVPPAGENWFEAGSVVNGSITSPAGGYQLAGYEGTGSLANDINPFFSIVLDQPTTLMWKWMPLGQNKVSLAVNTNYGTATPSGVTVYTAGDEVTCTVPAFIEQNGVRYESKGWSGGGSVPESGATNTATFVITENSIINWEWNVYYLLTIVNIGDLGNPDPAAGAYWLLEGTPITASVQSPVNNYFCTGFTGTGDVQSSSATRVGFTLTQPTTIQWNWVPISQVNTQLVVRSDYGNPTPAVGTSFYYSGAVVNAFVERSVFGSPGEIYICTGWTGTGSVGFFDTNPETGQTYFKQTGPEVNITFVIRNSDPNSGAPYNNTLTWNWERRYYLKVVNPAGMPRAIPSAGSTPVPAGSTLTASVPPSSEMGPGLRVFCLGFRGTGAVPAEGTTSSVTITMTEPSTIEWVWEYRYEVIVENPAGFGTATPAPGTYWVPPGESFHAEITPFSFNHACQGYLLKVGDQTAEYTQTSLDITVDAPTVITWSWDYLPLSWYEAIDVKTNEGDVPFYLDLERSPATSSPWICYQDVADKDLHVVYYSVDKWVNQNLDSFGDVGAFCNLKVDEEGTVRIAYYDETNRILKVAERLKGVWNIQVVDGSEGSGRFCSINYSPEGKWGIAYLDNSDLAHPKIKYAEKFQNDWLVEIVREFDGVIEYLSLVYYNEQPVIVFYDAAEGKLRYLYYDAEWILDTVDGTPDCGRFCQAAINPATGHPGVVYYDLSNHRLKFAQRQTDFTWNIQVVDATGDVGYYPNLLYDDEGKPRISYQDVGRQRLKFALFDGIFWQISVLAEGEGNVGWMPALSSYGEGEMSIIYLDNGAIKYISSKPEPDEESIAASRAGSGGCFVATAAFGSMSASSVRALTELRDAGLAACGTGSALVSLYYAVSPAPARAEGGSPALRALMRELLDFGL